MFSYFLNCPKTWDNYSIYGGKDKEISKLSTDALEDL
jgi:hypothetical protein